METIDDIRRQYNNPRAGAVAGPPRSVFSFFHGTTGRLLSSLGMILGLLVLLVGSMLFVAPLMIAGIVLLVFSGLAFIWSKPPGRAAL